MQKVGAQDVCFGLGADMLAKLDRAVQMAPGKLPQEETEKWKAYLGTETVMKARPAPEVVAKKHGQAAPTVQPTRSSMSSPALKASRPERPGTKRRYNETSFKGYGEGYADDDMAESTGGEEDGRSGGKKRRRKV